MFDPAGGKSTNRFRKRRARRNAETLVCRRLRCRAQPTSRLCDPIRLRHRPDRSTSTASGRPKQWPLLDVGLITVLTVNADHPASLRTPWLSRHRPTLVGSQQPRRRSQDPIRDPPSTYPSRLPRPEQGKVVDILVNKIESRLSGVPPSPARRVSFV